jgi:hypothetical protein
MNGRIPAAILDHRRTGVGRLATDAIGIACEFILLRWNIAGSAYGENSSSISIATGAHLSSQGAGLVAGTVIGWAFCSDF